jgi:hypothetical protein
MQRVMLLCSAPHTRSEASLTPVPKPNAGSEGLDDRTCEPKPERSMRVEGSGSRIFTGVRPRLSMPSAAVSVAFRG